MSALYQFLQRNDVSVSKSLPLLHTTRAVHLRSILSSGEIRSQECDVFVNERLNYFFVGRPSYKFDLSANAAFWELPICFVMNFGSLGQPKRRYPFDSGGFSKGLLPGYLKHFERDAFEVSSDARANEKLVGTFFGTPFDYFRHKPRKGSNLIEQFDISMLEAELHALHQLSSVRGDDFDDRQFVIEEQYDHDISLKAGSLSAIIVPDVYLEDPAFLELVENYSCNLISYNTFPLNPEAYFYAIYGHVETHFHELGLL